MVYGINQPKINQPMNNYITALKAEHIKKKGTGMYWLAVIMGAFMPFFYSIVMIVQNLANEDMGRGKSEIPYNYFTKILEEMLGGYAEFFFPLLIIISVSRITQLDHKNGGWQLMETQPVNKWAIYSSKFTVLLITNLISILILVAASYLAGGLMMAILEIPKAATFGFEAGPVLNIVLRLFVAGLFFTALQYLISVLMPSFVWSMLIGFFLLLGYLFLKIFNVTPGWYPLAILGKVSDYKNGSELGYWLIYSEVAAIVLTAATIYIGFNWYRHKGIKAAFAGTAVRAASLVGVLALTVLLSWYIFKPNMYEAHNRTVISGKLESKDKVKILYILDNFIQDTVAAIPVVNNHFQYEIKKDIPLDSYKFTFENGVNSYFYFGKNDSIYLDIKKYGNSVDGKITGTRLAENQYKPDSQSNFAYVGYMLEQKTDLDNVSFYTRQIYKEWDDAMNATDKFRTADNYVPRTDFVSYSKKLITLTYLNYWYDLVKMRKAVYPGQPTKPTPEIAGMIKSVSLHDDALLSNEAYFNYVTSRLIENNEADIDESTKILRAIAVMKPGTFKDKLLFWQLKSSLREANTIEERANLMKYYAYTFKDTKYSNIVAGINKTLDGIAKGKEAPAIAGTTIDNKPFSLEQYKGKLIAIDVWATWCGPCREESPKFEKIALKYKKEGIQFVALSTDRKIEDWYMDAKLKSKSVLQVHIDNNEFFSTAYDVEFIPRFILIGKDGKLINAKMPRPGEKTFEDIIRKELGMKEL
jgi:thiol-disulfide isomerase/thioredoxin